MNIKNSMNISPREVLDASSVYPQVISIANDGTGGGGGGPGSRPAPRYGSLRRGSASSAIMSTGGVDSSTLVTGPGTRLERYGYTATTASSAQRKYYAFGQRRAGDLGGDLRPRSPPDNGSSRGALANSSTISASDQHTYSEPLYNQSPMQVYIDRHLQRQSSHNNLNGTLPRYSATTMGSNSNVDYSSGTTGPMVPLPNNLHPSHLLEPSNPPPLLLRPGLSSAHHHHHQGGGQGPPGSALAAFASRRFNFNFGKTCSSGGCHDSLWKVATIALIFICLTLLSVVAYKEDDSKPCIIVEGSSVGDKGGSSSVTSSSAVGGEAVASNSASDTGGPGSGSNGGHGGSRTTESTASVLSGGSGSGGVVRSESLSSCHALNLPRNPISFPEIKVSVPFPMSTSLEAFASWSGSFVQPAGGFLRFHFLGLPPWARLAFIAGKNEPPTLTQHELLELINPNKHNGAGGSGGKFKKRESSSSLDQSAQSHRSGVSVELLDYFEAGNWYITVVNDGQETVPLVLNISAAADIRTHCNNNCNGHGKCHMGKCQCFPGYIGHDCADSVCPILCSGHGRYQNGRCACEAGWKGVECNVRATECEVSDCNGHGKCISGTCQCLAGFKGDYCEERDCPDTTCYGNGACVEGQCLCKTGWAGTNCSDIDQRVSKFFPDCSSRGVYDLDSQRCVCFSGWLGDDCSLAKCNLDCGSNGVCEGSVCVCSSGWEGLRCERKKCDSRCLDHGQCRNGSCVCSQGWLGKHCSLNGCPGGCSGQGECSKHTGPDGSESWRCHCRQGWTGKDCSHSLETNCADDIDNDNDGLFDCADSECCSKDACRDSLMCLTSPDPLDILLRKPPPSVTASFYQKMKFLIEEGSVQSYAHRDEYSESRVSVIRGQVVTPDGNGLTGIRISVATDPQFGFTLTRPDGWFDILVNGGSMVTLQFQRSPFHPIKRTVMVPWNEIIVIQTPIVMSAGADEVYMVDASLPDHDLSGQDLLAGSSHRLNRSVCSSHDYQVVRPVLATKKLAAGRVPVKTSSPSNSAPATTTAAESQVLQETLPVPGSGVKLSYQSSSSPGYLSTINLDMTGEHIPSSLRLVYLRIVVEGNLFTKLFEAEPLIKFTYAWNKRNVYRQKVYGLATARVYVGYEYANCPQIIWSTLTTTLRGFDMEISELGSWNLDIHHRYNFHQGVLQKGDGSAIYFKQQSRVASVLIGESRQPRSLLCSSQECDGPAKANKLLSPISLTSGPDGSVYVGDANLIRRITPEGYVYTVFKASDKSSAIRGKAPVASGVAAGTTYNYHILLSPYDGHLYVADPERHQILRVHSVDRVEHPESNYDVFVGSGARCLPRDPSKCGDEGSALDARLSFPKGMAFGLDGSLYLADGHAIRLVNTRGLIHTIIGGNNDHSRHGGQWKPIPCGRSLPADELKLRWPTELAVHPIDGSLYFLDDQMVFRLTADHRVMVAVGSPSYCKFSAGRTSSEGQSKTMKRDHLSGASPPNGHEEEVGIVVSFAFAANGDMFVASVGQDGINRVSLVSQEGRSLHFMGLERPQNLYGMAKCEVETCKDINAKNCTCAVAMMTGSSSSVPFSAQLLSDDPLAEARAKGVSERLARETPLASISSIAVTADGVVHVADEGSFQIVSAVPFIPAPDDQMQFSMASTETNELYVFNKYGQQVLTKNARTGQTLYSFLYDVNTSFGKLSAVVDSSGSKVSFLRDSAKALYSIETSAGYVCRVTVNNQGLLEVFVDADGLSTRFYYEPETGLLKRRSDSSGFSLFYEYDFTGRLVGVI